MQRTFSSSKQDDYVAYLEKLITNFSTLTNVDTFFYSLNQQIIDRKQIFTSSQNIYNYLSRLNFDNLTIFPVILDDAFFGFLGLNINAGLTDRIQMYRSYLQSTSQRLNVDFPNHQMKILNPLERLKLKDCLNGFDLIKSDELNDPQATTMSSSNYSAKNLHLVNQPLDTDSKGSSADSNLVKALHYIDENITKSLTLEDVAQSIYISPSYLSRLFKKAFNVNFVDYINTRKMALAQKKLTLEDAPINKLAKELGFSQTSYFTKMFKLKCQVTPSKFRKLNKKTFVKIYTISRDLSWLNNQSVYDVSKQYFQRQRIDFKDQTFNGYPFVYSINGLGEGKTDGGWIYTTDCLQPMDPPSMVTVGDKSVIQWTYLRLDL